MDLDNRGHVLIVEDDEHIRRFIAIHLDGSGFHVSEAATGETALESFEASRPDVVVLDVMLPDSDGFEVCERLREIDTEVVIVFLTARGQDLDRIKGLELGADDYIVKPFNPLELTARIRTVLRRTRKSGDSAHAVLQSGAIRLDLTANKLYKHGEPIEATPKEFLMVKAFMEHPDVALTRNELLNLVWGEDFVGDTKTVDVHVRRLREKLEEDSSRPQRIETVWGVGYRWRKDD